MDCKVKSGS